MFSFDFAAAAHENTPTSKPPVIAPKPSTIGPKPPPIGSKPKIGVVAEQPVYDNAPTALGVIKPRPPPNPNYPPISIHDFPSHVQQNFANDGEGFKNQFKVTLSNSTDFVRRLLNFIELAHPQFISIVPVLHVK